MKLNAMKSMMINSGSSPYGTTVMRFADVPSNKPPSRKRTRSMYVAGSTRSVPAPTPTLPTTNFMSTNTAAWAMMRKMGYEPGCGLGASKQGRLSPVTHGAFRGRAGLGHPVYRLGNMSVDDNEEEDEWLYY